MTESGIADPQATANRSGERALPDLFQDFRDYHPGASIIVCGCGSSLNELVEPDRFITVGVNDVGRLFDPDYLVVLNSRAQFSMDRYRYVVESRATAVFSHLKLNIEHAPLVRFILGRRGGVDFDNPNRLPYTRNSPYVAVCLAIHMGAKRVGLIGVDFTANHFFASTGRHKLSNELEQINCEYARLAHACTARGILLYNLSSDSAVTSLPKCSLGEFAEHAKSSRSLKFVSYATTPVAGVPRILSRCIEERTAHRCRTVWASNSYGNGVCFDGDVEWNRRPEEARTLLSESDIVVVHNGRVHPSHQSCLQRKAVMTLAHNYMWNVDTAFVKRGFPGLVVGQYQASLAEFNTWQAVPNPMPCWLPEFSTADKVQNICIAYTPSGKHEKYPNGHRLYWHGKGYETTMAVLQRLARRYPIELQVIAAGQIPFTESLNMKRRAHIVIDECVTGSYHRNSLEGLAAGCVVVNGLGLVPGIRDVFHHCTGGEDNPFTFATLETLEQVLSGLIEEGVDALLEKGRHSRRWIQQHWNFERQWHHFWLPAVEQAFDRAGKSYQSRTIPVVSNRTPPVVEKNHDTDFRNHREPRASVIIPHGGVERLPHLKAALTHLKQCRGIGEIITVELGVFPVADELAKRYSGKYIFVSHDGPFERGRALNIGSDFADYDFILWMDNDLLIPSDLIPSALAEMQTDQLDYLIPYAAVCYLSQADSLAVMQGCKNPRDSHAVNRMRSGIQTTGGMGMVKKDFLTRNGGFIEGFKGWGGEDNAWSHKVRLLGRTRHTRYRNLNVYHLHHPCSGGNKDGSNIRHNPHYAANVQLLTRIKHIRSGEQLLREFPPRTRRACPWQTSKKIVFICMSHESRHLAHRLQQNFRNSYTIEPDIKEFPITDSDADKADALVWFLPESKLRSLMPSLLSPLGKRSVLVFSSEQERQRAVANTVIRDRSIPCIGPSEHEGGIVEQQHLAGDTRLALVPSLSQVLAHPGPDTGGANSAELLPVWLYWVGECPPWIEQCRRTIFSHAPNVQLLDDEKFDCLWNDDRDIDIKHLIVPHRADFVRAYLLQKFGGLWIDSDCLVMRSLIPILEKLKSVDFIAHKERCGAYSNGFIGAGRNSRIAQAYYGEVVHTLRHTHSRGWTSLGSTPLSKAIRARADNFLELDCDQIQPICWSKPEEFFRMECAESQREKFNAQALCYMLSKTEVEKFQAQHPGRQLLAANTFFNFLLQQSLPDDAYNPPVEHPLNQYRMIQPWEYLPFAFDLFSEIKPRRILEIGMNSARWATLIREYGPFWQAGAGRDHSVHIESVPFTSAGQAAANAYDRVHTLSPTQTDKTLNQRWDLIIVGFSGIDEQTAIDELDTLLDHTDYLICDVSKPRPLEGNPIDIVSRLKSLKPLRYLCHDTASAYASGFFLFSSCKAKDVYTGEKLQSLFTATYRSNLALVKHEGESASGPGSGLAQTQEIRQRLPFVFSDLDIHCVLDAPCGDFRWQRDVINGLNYTGIDIVTELVTANQKRFGTSAIRFQHKDLCHDLLPRADLILNRDCLVHFSFRDIFRALRQFKNSQSVYLLTTTFNGNRVNSDIESENWRPLNLQSPPFNFPAPMRLINEKCSEAGGVYADKCLGLWRLEDIVV